jgi:hypothetical protein
MMNKLWAAAPFLLAVFAVGVVLYQRAEVSGLRERVDGLVSAEPPTREIVRERVIEAAPTEPVGDAVAAPAAEAGVRATDLAALSARTEALERRLSLALTVLDGVTARPAAADAAAVAALAADLAALEADVEALHDDRAAAQAAGQPAPEPVVAPPPAPAPPPSLAERWRAHRDAADRAWMEGVSAAAELRPEQAQGLDALVGDLRTRQEATLQAVWRGDKSLVDAQIEMDAIERETSMQLERLLSGSQRRALQHRLTAYPAAGWSY